PATRFVAPPGTDGFHVAELAGFSDYGRPAVKVRFSSAIAARQAFDDLLDIRSAKGERPNGSWQLQDESTTLVFPYLEADTRYTLRIDAALAAAGDATLGQVFEHEIGRAACRERGE